MLCEFSARCKVNCRFRTVLRLAPREGAKPWNPNSGAGTLLRELVPQVLRKAAPKLVEHD